MITVNAWYPAKDNVGHASASIGGEAYVSWWPAGDWKKALPGAANTLDGDVAAEGRRPDEQVLVKGLDEKSAVAWWKALVASRGKYQAMTQNCAWAVISALKAGGADDRIGWTDTMTKYNIPIGTLSPLLCNQALMPAALFGGAQYKINWVDHCTSIWTPADAVRYARAIK